MCCDNLVNTAWRKENGRLGEVKEILGNKAWFHLCCGIRMCRVKKFQRVEGSVYKLGCSGWVCEVCGTRIKI